MHILYKNWEVFTGVKKGLRAAPRGALDEEAVKAALKAIDATGGRYDAAVQHILSIYEAVKEVRRLLRGDMAEDSKLR